MDQYKPTFAGNRDRAVKPVVIIVGMHRSMTSVVARALNLAGIHFGATDSLHSADASNPRGYWEYSAIVDAHDRLLHGLGRTWDTALPLPEGWMDSEPAAEARIELGEIVDKETRASEVWGWKDPRATLLLPLWLDLLEEHGLESRIVLCIRHPDQIASSIEVRDGIPRGQALGIWFNYLLAAARAIPGNRHVIVSAQNIVNAPEETIRLLLNRLALSDDVPKATNPSAFDELVDRGLFHWTLANDAALPNPCRDLWQALSRAESTNGLKHADLTIQRISREHAAWSSLLCHDFAILRRTHDALKAHHDQHLSETEDYIASLKRSHDALKAHHDQHLSETEDYIASLKRSYDALKTHHDKYRFETEDYIVGLKSHDRSYKQQTEKYIEDLKAHLARKEAALASAIELLEAWQNSTSGEDNSTAHRKQKASPRDGG